jgi:hypothetical protein
MTNISTEEKTFNRLRRTPFEDMAEHLNNITKYPPIYTLNGQVFETRKHEIVRHFERIRVLEKHGWSFEEYILEIEKRNIISAVDLYNRDNSFPMDLVNRALEFFPNARFTQAKIELE